MACQFHPDKPVAASCRECGALICEACAVELNERTICKQCIERLYKEGRTTSGESTSSRTIHHTRERFVSPMLVFLFSAIPGAAHMYMGLMKRGVFIMGAFFLSAALTSYSHGIVGMIIPIIFIMSFFDANNIRRKINRGECIEDEIEGIMGFLHSNKAVFAVLGSLCLLSMLFDGMRGFMGNLQYSSGKNIIPYIVLGAGIYFLVKRRKRVDRHEPAKHDDANNLDNNNSGRE